MTSKKAAHVPVMGRHIPSLDGIRGLAILLILAEHVFWSNEHPEGGRLIRFFAELHGAGWIGVDLFFVLSGFLITGILVDSLPKQHYFRNFYVRRALRIFPLYYSVLAVLYLAVRLSGNTWSPEFYQLLTYTSNLHLRVMPPFTTANWVNINHFWSLAVEEQFYLLWPLLIFFLRTRRAIVGAAVVGALFSFGLRLSLLHSPALAANHYLLYSWTPARLDGLLAGAALAVFVRSRFVGYVFLIAKPVLGVCTVILGIVWWRNSGLNWEHSLWMAVWVESLLAIFFSALIAAALQQNSMYQRCFSARWLRFFGRYSYGLYVYHYSLCAIVLPLRRGLFALGYSKAVSVLIPGLIIIALSTILAWLSYHFFERRFLVLKKIFDPRQEHPVSDNSGGISRLAQETSPAGQVSLLH